MLQIYHHLPMTKEECKNSKEIIGKLEAYFKPKRNIIYIRYMFFSGDQEVNEKSDAYLASLRRVASSCESAQLEELIKDRIALGTKNGAVQAYMLRELPLTLDQVAMCRKSEITQQYLQQFQKQYNEEVSYTRWHMQIGYQSLRDQTDDSDRKRNNQGRRDFCTNWSIQKSHPLLSQNTLLKRKLRILKQKRSSGWHLYWWKQKAVNVMKFQIDNGLSCNVISHSLICKLLLDGNPKLQESKKLQMYDKSVMIPMA